VGRTAFDDVSNQLAAAVARVRALIGGNLDPATDTLQAVHASLEDAGALSAQLHPATLQSDCNEEIFLSAIVEGANAKILVNCRGRITLANARAEKLFGYMRGELLGRSVEALVPGRFRHQHSELRDVFDEAPVARVMGTGRNLYGLRKDGTEIPIEIGLKPIATQAGTFTLASITEREPADRLRLLHLGMQQHVKTEELHTSDLQRREHFALRV
jgi:PAS domain S-box-containing protein